MANPLIMPQAVAAPSGPEVRAIANGGLGPPPPQTAAGGAGAPPGGGPPVAAAAPAMPTPQTPPDPEMLQKAHDNLGVILSEMSDLVAKSPGALTRKDVMDAAGRMIKQGAFAHPDAKKMLVSQLADLPDNEQGIRQFLGHHLLQFAAARNAVGQHLQGLSNAPLPPEVGEA